MEWALDWYIIVKNVYNVFSAYDQVQRTLEKTCHIFLSLLLWCRAPFSEYFFLDLRIIELFPNVTCPDKTRSKSGGITAGV